MLLTFLMEVAMGSQIINKSSPNGLICHTDVTLESCSNSFKFYVDDNLKTILNDYFKTMIMHNIAPTSIKNKKDKKIKWH